MEPLPEGLPVKLIDQQGRRGLRETPLSSSLPHSSQYQSKLGAVMDSADSLLLTSLTTALLSHAIFVLYEKFGKFLVWAWYCLWCPALMQVFFSVCRLIWTLGSVDDGWGWGVSFLNSSRHLS